MKFLTYNVHGWLTPDGSASNVDLLVEVIAATGADLVGLNEVFHPWRTPPGRRSKFWRTPWGWDMPSGRPCRLSLRRMLSPTVTRCSAGGRSWPMRPTTCRPR